MVFDELSFLSRPLGSFCKQCRQLNRHRRGVFIIGDATGESAAEVRAEAVTLAAVAEAGELQLQHSQLPKSRAQLPDDKYRCAHRIRCRRCE